VLLLDGLPEFPALSSRRCVSSSRTGSSRCARRRTRALHRALSARRHDQGL